jgi:hypothetical protein
LETEVNDVLGSFCISIVLQIILFVTRMCRDSDVEPRGGPFIKGFEKQVEEGSENGAFPFIGAL